MHDPQIHPRKVPIDSALQIGRRQHVFHLAAASATERHEVFPEVRFQPRGTVLRVEQVGLAGEFGVLLCLLVGQGAAWVGRPTDPVAARAHQVEPLTVHRLIAAAQVRMGAGQGDFPVRRGYLVEGEVAPVFVAGDQMHHLAGRIGRQMEIDYRYR